MIDTENREMTTTVPTKETTEHQNIGTQIRKGKVGTEIHEHEVTGTM